MGKFLGIGQASAAMVFAALAANPSTTFLTTGWTGKILFSFLKYLFGWFASLGLIALNIGASKVETIIAGNDYEKIFGDADAMIAKLRSAGQELTPEQVAAIDQKVIDAFRKFAHFGKAQDAKNQNNASNSSNG